MADRIPELTLIAERCFLSACFPGHEMDPEIRVCFLTLAPMCGFGGSGINTCASVRRHRAPHDGPCDDGKEFKASVDFKNGRRCSICGAVNQTCVCLRADPTPGAIQPRVPICTCRVCEVAAPSTKSGKRCAGRHPEDALLSARLHTECGGARAHIDRAIVEPEVVDRVNDLAVLDEPDAVAGEAGDHGRSAG